MCGIIGMISKREYGFTAKNNDIFQQLLYVDALRGWDATGVFGVNKYGNIDILKSSTAAGAFLLTDSFTKFKENIFSKYRIAFGHNRKATHGEKNAKSAHPFWSKDENICLIHNGMIHNHKEFCTEATVDSDAICNALEKNTIQEVIEKIDGAFALVWYNVAEKTLYFIRNDARPLCMIETDDNYYFSSEAGAPHWILHRNSEKITKMTDIPPNILHSFSLEKKEIVVGEEIKKKSLPISTIPYMETTPSVKVQTISVTGANDLNYIEHNPLLFLTDDQLPTHMAVKAVVKRNMQLQFTIDTYEYTDDKKAVILSGTILNVLTPNIIVKMRLTPEAFDVLDIVDPLITTVAGVRTKTSSTIIWVRDPEPMVIVETDGLVISDAMWMDDAFPIHCDGCGAKLFFKDLKKGFTYIEPTGGVQSYCPHCLGDV